MAAPHLRVAVAGAGFAGLATAALLARSGHRVTVYEKFAQPRAVGAGILIQPIGLAAMKAIGVADAVLASGARIDHLYGLSHRGRRVVDIRYDHWQSGSFGVGLHRGVLFESLWELARSAGAELRTGEDIRDLQALRSAHDLTVVADGSRSSLRCQTGLASTDRVYPWGAMWTVLEDPQRRYGTKLHQWYRGAHEMLGIMPTGCAPGSTTPVVSLFWSLHADRAAAFREAGLAGFKHSVLALHRDAGPLLDQLTSLDQLTWARYHDVVMPTFHSRDCVVIGDAAHATSPQLGQGTNLAMLDAVALDESLRHAGTVPEALAAYTATRQSHLRFYGEASRWLTPLFQSDLKLLPFLRDLFMASSSRLPIAGRLTLETLVGVRQAWLRGETLPVGPAPLGGGEKAAA